MSRNDTDYQNNNAQNSSDYYDPWENQNYGYTRAHVDPNELFDEKELQQMKKQKQKQQWYSQDSQYQQQYQNPQYQQQYQNPQYQQQYQDQYQEQPQKKSHKGLIIAIIVVAVVAVLAVVGILFGPKLIDSLKGNPEANGSSSVETTVPETAPMAQDNPEESGQGGSNAAASSGSESSGGQVFKAGEYTLTLRNANEVSLNEQKRVYPGIREDSDREYVKDIFNGIEDIQYISLKLGYDGPTSLNLEMNNAAFTIDIPAGDEAYVLEFSPACQTSSVKVTVSDAAAAGTAAISEISFYKE